MTEQEISPEEVALGQKITDLGNQIKEAKTNGKPKEEWDPLLQQMLAAKNEFKATFGKDFGAPASNETKKEKSVEPEEASDKNKEKRAAKAAAKAQKEAEKAAKRAERERREKDKADRLAGVGQENFGDAPMVQSQTVTSRKWTKIEELEPSMAGQNVLVRGYLQVSRGVGKGAFVLVRSTFFTVQGVAFQSDTISDVMVKYIAGLQLESVVDM